MAGKKPISDERIIAALVQYGNTKEAAAAAGLTVASFKRRIKNGNLENRCKEEKNPLLKEAAEMARGKIKDALKVVENVMADNTAPLEVRLEAAQTILRLSNVC